MMTDLLFYVGVGILGGLAISAMMFAMLATSTASVCVFGKPKSCGFWGIGSMASKAYAYLLLSAAFFVLGAFGPYPHFILAGVHLAVAVCTWFNSTRVFRITDVHSGYVQGEEWPLSRVKGAIWDEEAEVLHFWSERFAERGERDVALLLTPRAWQTLQEKAAAHDSRIQDGLAA